MGYVGIDTDQFPGLAQLLAVSKAGVSWCGYYLVAPSHQESGWSGQRAAVEAAGLACVPIYVGQQIVGPGSHRTGPIQGTMDGNDAAAKMQAEGFRPGQVVYLDLENGAPFAAPQTDYVAAWCRQVIAGGFRAGVYCSHKIAEAVSIANPGAIIWAFEVPTLEPSTASPPFAAPDPAGCGFLEACIWQHEDTVTISGEGFHLVVDLDSSIIANPALGSAQPMPLPAAARQGPAPPSPAPRPAPAPLAPPAPDLFIPPPPSPPAAHPQPVAAVVQHGPPIAAGAAGAVAVGATAIAGAHSVDLTYFIDTMWPLVVTGVIVPLMIWLIGRGLQYFHIQTQSALADEIRTVAMNGVYEATSAFQGYADAHPEIDVSSAVAARAAQYVVNAVPGKLARLGVSSSQLANLVDAQLAKVKAPA